MNIMDKFKKYTEISDVTEAALLHANQFAEVAEEHHKIHLRALQLKSKKSQVEAEIDEHIRNFYNAGLADGDAKTKTKLTEAQIQAKIQADPKFKDITDEANKAESELALANHLLDAMKQRARMISALLSIMED